MRAYWTDVDVTGSRVRLPIARSREMGELLPIERGVGSRGQLELRLHMLSALVHEPSHWTFVDLPGVCRAVRRFYEQG